MSVLISICGGSERQSEIETGGVEEYTFAPSSGRRPKGRILIADDERQIREILMELLSQDYECRAVSSAEEALSLLRVEKFALVLSDIRMSGLSGLDMLPQAAQIAPDALVIMMSGERDIESAIRAMRHGAFDYITKPFEFEYVELAVRRALEYYELRETKSNYERLLEELIERRTAQRDFISWHDPLTGLPNRNLFTDRLNQAVAQAQHAPCPLAVMFIAIDRFKQISDTFGLLAGDEAMREAAKRFSILANEGDTIAAWDSGEFALLALCVGGTDDALKIVRGAQDALKDSFPIGMTELFLTASIGVSFCSAGNESADNLLCNARTALRRVKQNGGNDVQFYRAELSANARRRLEMESALRRALENKEFVLHYQPQVDARTRRLVGAEALVRWQRPGLGMASPAEFIPVAEQNGLIAPIGKWVLHAACAQNKAWQDAGFAPIRMAVNLSLRQFQQPDLAENIERTLNETGLDPQYLEIELTESSVMSDADLASESLCALKRIGIKIAVDDFGTGYSSLSHLKRFPIDKLKLDKSFVSYSTSDPKDAAIVKASHSLAHSLGLEVVAEGVETEEQLSFLQSLGCDQAQGYFFSAPLPAETFVEKFLNDKSRLG